MLFSQNSDAAQPAMFRIPLSPEYEFASVQHRDTVLQIRWGSGRRELGKESIDHGRGTVRINLPQISVSLAPKTLYLKAIRFNTHGHSLSITTMSTLFLLSFEKKSSLLLLLLW